MGSLGRDDGEQRQRLRGRMRDCDRAARTRENSVADISLISRYGNPATRMMRRGPDKSADARTAAESPFNDRHHNDLQPRQRGEQTEMSPSRFL